LKICKAFFLARNSHPAGPNLFPNFSAGIGSSWRNLYTDQWLAHSRFRFCRTLRNWPELGACMASNRRVRRVAAKLFLAWFGEGTRQRKERLRRACHHVESPTAYLHYGRCGVCPTGAFQNLLSRIVTSPSQPAFTSPSNLL
jgi:hypothetical protein